MYGYFLDVHSRKGKGALQVAYINCLELIQFSEESSEGTADCGHMVLAMWVIYNHLLSNKLLRLKIVYMLLRNKVNIVFCILVGHKRPWEK